jgi:hypothetical protein
MTLRRAWWRYFELDRATGEAAVTTPALVHAILHALRRPAAPLQLEPGASAAGFPSRHAPARTRATA